MNHFDLIDGALHAEGVPLSAIAEAVGTEIEVWMDGGIRSGQDLLKALAMGARAAMIGRAYAYGLGAAGAAGVTRAIEILTADLNRTLRLLGCASPPPPPVCSAGSPGSSPITATRALTRTTS